jgi:hypothetical protein
MISLTSPLHGGEFFYLNRNPMKYVRAGSITGLLLDLALLVALDFGVEINNPAFRDLNRARPVRAPRDPVESSQTNVERRRRVAARVCPVLHGGVLSYSIRLIARLTRAVIDAREAFTKRHNAIWMASPLTQFYNVAPV